MANHNRGVVGLDGVLLPGGFAVAISKGRVVGDFEATAAIGPGSPVSLHGDVARLEQLGVRPRACGLLFCVPAMLGFMPE